MIKNTELRIGNLAQDAKTGALLRVIGLSEEDISYYVVDRSKFPLPDGWKAEPIPLTPEWLERFSIVFNDSVNGWVIDNTYLIEKIATSHGWYFVVKHKKGLQIGGYLQYVHLLQNIFWLLYGEELYLNELTATP